MWDNRETKKSPKQPDYKCKNRTCDKAVWLEKKANGNGGATAGAGPGVNGARSSRPLGPLYFQCLKIAAASVQQELKKAGITPTGADVVAATATLFIAATNTGAPITTPKAKPAPPPPPPPPPQQEPEQEEYDEADLPF